MTKKEGNSHNVGLDLTKNQNSEIRSGYFHFEENSKLNDTEIKENKFEIKILK